MTRVATITCMLLIASAARAQDDEEAAPLPAVRIDGASVHAAARFLAEVHEVGVWVASIPGPALSFTTTGDAEEAFERLASAARLAVRRRDQRSGPVFWVAAENRLLRAESASIRGLSGGRRIDLDFEGVEATELASLLGAVSRVSVRGVPLGAVTVRMRGARSSRALEILARLADARVARRGREVSMRLGSYPDWPRSEPCESSRGVRLTCAPIERLRLVGLAPERALVALPGVQSVILAVGDRVGAAGWRVEAIEDDSIELANGDTRRALHLGSQTR